MAATTAQGPGLDVTTPSCQGSSSAASTANEIEQVHILVEQVDVSKAPEVSADVRPSASQRLANCCKQALIGVWDLACEHWFILGVGLAIGIAGAVPDFGRNGGWVRSEWSVKYGAVIVIFLLSGLSLKSRVLAQAATRLPLHFLVQLLCLGLTPLIGFAVASPMRTNASLNQDLVSGLIVATSMPTTVSTNVVFTKQASGNDAVALINAVIGNVIGIFVSPALLLLYLKESGQAPYSLVLQQLGATVIGPLVVGQVIQYLLPKRVSWLQTHVNFGKVSNVMILLLVWQTFSNTFAQKVTADAGSLVLVLLMCILFYPLFTAICLGIAMLSRQVSVLDWLLRMKRSDDVALVMCGATKTLALGMPLIGVLYAGQPNAGLLALPLIVYHASQILQGNLLIGVLKRYVAAEPKPVLAAAPEEQAPVPTPERLSPVTTAEEQETAAVSHGGSHVITPNDSSPMAMHQQLKQAVAVLHQPALGQPTSADGLNTDVHQAA